MEILKSRSATGLLTDIGAAGIDYFVIDYLEPYAVQFIYWNI